MSDGGWYGYPPQEPDPYAQAQDDWNRPPLDYNNPPQAPGYPSYGQQSGQQTASQYYDYQQQPQAQPQPQQPQPPQPQPPQGGRPPRAQQPPQDPRYRQQRPPQSSQNPYVQPGQPGQPGQAQGYPSGSYDTGGYAAPRQQYDTGRQPRVGYDGYASGSYDTGARPAAGGYPGGYDSGTNPGTGAGYASGSYDTGGYPAQNYPSGSYDTGARPAAGGYPGGSGTRGRRSGPADPYGDPRDARDPRDPRDARDPRDPRGARDPYAERAEAEDQDAYEYPGRGGRRRAESEQPAPGRSGSRARYAPEEEGGYDEDGERLGLLTAGEDSDEGDSGGKGKKRSGSGKKDRKGHSCLAVFVLFSILAGLLGYGVFQGHKWYEAKYGPPADFTSTTGIAATVVVYIPSGSGGDQIGSILLQDDVVKSQRAFTQACEANPQCANIQANTYLLHKEMSAASAVSALLDTANVYNKSQLLVRPGERAADVFKDLEQKTNWTQAQILAAISSGKVDLPSWANAKTGPNFPFADVEGLLFTGTYQLPDYKDPTSLIKAMIDQQLAMFNAVGLSTKAKAAGGMNLTPYQVLIVASMARAEAGTDSADLGKIAGVIYHRLQDTADFAHLGFDTTTLYGMGETTTTPDNKDTSNPYNTSVYGIKGLPPGPIDSIDQATLEAALSPSDSTDLYFCAVDGSVLYAATSTAWNQLGKEHPGLCGD